MKISNQLKGKSIFYFFFNSSLGIKIHVHSVTMKATSIEDELKFIDEQLVSKIIIDRVYFSYNIIIIVAEEKNKNLKSDVEELKLQLLKTDPNFKFWCILNTFSQ